MTDATSPQGSPTAATAGHEQPPADGTVVTAWGHRYGAMEGDPPRRHLPSTGPFFCVVSPTGATFYFVGDCEIDPATISAPLPVDTAGPTVGLIPESWKCPDGADAYTDIELFGPDGHAGHVRACMPAKDSGLVPAGAPLQRFLEACTHLVASEVRAAYDAGDLVLPRPFQPRTYDVDIDLAAVDALLQCGGPLPNIGTREDRNDLGWGAYDTWQWWPLIYAGLSEREAGVVTLTLEVDAEEGPILTFNINVTREAASAHSGTGVSTADPFWRALTAVAVDAIRDRAGRGEIAVPDDLVFLEVTLDLAEANRLSSDVETFAALVDKTPTRWLAQTPPAVTGGSAPD